MIVAEHLGENLPEPELNRRVRSEAMKLLSDKDGGRGLRKHLLSRYKKGKLTAQALCTTAYHAVRGGAQGIEDLALDPASHHHAEHLRMAIEARSLDQFYFADIPMHNHENESRELIPFPLSLPHEEFAREFALKPHEFMISEQTSPQLPPTWNSNIIVEENGADRVCPLGYFQMRCHTQSETALWHFTGAMS